MTAYMFLEEWTNKPPPPPGTDLTRPRVAPKVIVVTDGHGWRVLGSAGLAGGTARRGKRYFRPGERFPAGDAREALAHLSLSASSAIAIGEIMETDEPLEQAAARLAAEHGHPVIDPDRLPDRQARAWRAPLPEASSS